jgi:hypothetical protein
MSDSVNLDGKHNHVSFARNNIDCEVLRTYLVLVNLKLHHQIMIIYVPSVNEYEVSK